MSDPTLQSLADQLRVLTARLDECTSGLGRVAADINRLGELTSVLQAGQFASGIEVSGAVQIAGHLRSKGGDHLHVDTPALFVHGGDIILDGRSRELNPKLYRALVDGGNQLIINFNGDYADGVVCQSGLVVNGQVTTQAVDVGAPSASGQLRVKNAEGADAIRLDGASGRVSSHSVIVDSLESSQGNAGPMDINAAAVVIHGSDVILDGRSKPLDPTRPYRALVDFGDKLIVNFHGDYHGGVLVESDLSANDLSARDVIANSVTVGANGADSVTVGWNEGGVLTVSDQAGSETVTIFGKSGNIHAKKIFAALHPPGADCAEQFDVAGDVAVEPGTVMVIGADGALEPCTTAYDARAAGVISGAGDLEPGLVLNEKAGANRAAIALMGTVYCKVDAERASISAGDLLTTSNTPGHGMKAVDPERSFGAVIGKALRPLSRGTGLIPVLVAPR